MPWTDFQADRPHDVITLAQSPPFTPPEAYELFAVIRDRYVDENAFGSDGSRALFVQAGATVRRTR